MKFLVINGPNLNMMHFTEPGVAGQLDYNGLLDYLELCCTQMGMEVEFFQSNHEGDLIDEIQSAAGRADGIILNPGGYAHYSVAILDALRLCGVPAVEVTAQRARRARALPQDGHRLVRLSGPLHRRGHQRLSPRCRLSGPAAARSTAVRTPI